VPIPLLIDCDTGKDDAVALLLACASPEVDLIGVTTVAGNVELEKTTRNTLAILELAGRDDIPVAAGADRPLIRELGTAAYVHGNTGLGSLELPEPSRPVERQHAVDFLAEKILDAPEPVTLAPIGPATNVALLLARYPEVAGRLERIVSMQGAIGLGNRTPAAEFNTWVDPEAAKRMFGAGIEHTMVGLDVTNPARIMPEHVERMRASGRVGTAVAALFDSAMDSPIRRPGEVGFGCPDSVTLTHVIRQDVLTTAHVHVEVDCEGELDRGRTLCDMRGRLGQEPNCHVAHDVDVETFVEFLTERICSYSA
jgi:inosine-uridine nucleoside N-ribohydrolase